VNSGVIVVVGAVVVVVVAMVVVVVLVVVSGAVVTVVAVVVGGSPCDAHPATRARRAARTILLGVAATDDIAEHQTPDRSPDNRVLPDGVNGRPAGDPNDRGE
jgi:hypothetical protein